MIERTAERFDLKPEYLAADTAYGSAEMLNWVVNEKKIAPHIPVIDKSKHEDGTFSREEFRFEKGRNVYICPAGKLLTTTGHIGPDHAIRYFASLPDCRACALKPKCCPNMPARRIVRDVNEDARDIARALIKTEDFEQSRRNRKRVEMLFAHLKRILKLGRCGYAAHAVRKMSLPLLQLRRTYADLRSWSLDRHQWPMHVLRSQCQVSVPFDACVTTPQRAEDENRSKKSRQQPRRYNRRLLQQNLPLADQLHCSKKAFGFGYSTTSSAIASTPGGMVRPSVLAVLRSITNSNLVGCKTCKSVGFSPLRIRSVLDDGLPPSIWTTPAATDGRKA